MSQTAKISFFILAVVTMACFACASVMMAEGRGGYALSLFILAIVLVGCGFMVRKRILRRAGQR
jgi:hypothetical protein